ncbi:hypothetical+protein [Methylocapsa aurea]|uniref:hypothetical protein n=1 Tax=Methylocapsa aurea TaxID=663610 RepID=UPI003D18A5BF
MRRFSSFGLPASALFAVVYALLLTGTPTLAEEATWFFEAKNDASPAKFGFTSGSSGESVFVSGACEKNVHLDVAFRLSALAELVKSGAYPSINFVMDGVAEKFAIGRLNMNESGPSMWTPTVEGLPKELFEKWAKAKKVSIQLLAAEKVLDIYQASTDRGRAKAIAKVAKECF